MAGIQTIEQANEYLINDYLVWWEREMTVDAANPDNAHRRLEKGHDLAASLSHVETRQVRPDYTLRWNGKVYQIARDAITPGLRRANVRVEERLDGTIAVRHGEQYLPVEECTAPEKVKKSPRPKPEKARRPHERGSDWNKNFDLKKGPKVWQAAQGSDHRPKEAVG